MIVVIGRPGYAEAETGEGIAVGLAVDVALACVSQSRRVELVGKVGDDPAGDAVVLALGRAGVGHAAIQRDPARATPLLAGHAARDPGSDEGDVAALVGDPEGAGGDEPSPAVETAPPSLYLPDDPARWPTLDAGDVELALRYLPDVRTVVVAEPLAPGALEAVGEVASFSGARLVVLAPAATELPGLPPDTTVLESPASDDGSFARFVGTFAAGLDAGREAARAFRDAVAESGWERVAE